MVLQIEWLLFVVRSFQCQRIGEASYQRSGPEPTSPGFSSLIAETDRDIQRKGQITLHRKSVAPPEGTRLGPQQTARLAQIGSNILCGVPQFLS